MKSTPTVGDVIVFDGVHAPRSPLAWLFRRPRPTRLQPHVVVRVTKTTLSVRYPHVSWANALLQWRLFAQAGRRWVHRCRRPR